MEVIVDIKCKSSPSKLLSLLTSKDFYRVFSRHLHDDDEQADRGSVSGGWTGKFFRKNPNGGDHESTDQELTDMNNSNPLHLRNRFLDYHPKSLPSSKLSYIINSYHDFVILSKYRIESAEYVSSAQYSINQSED
jgi:hypothetical protein